MKILIIYSIILSNLLLSNEIISDKNKNIVIYNDNLGFVSEKK